MKDVHTLLSQLSPARRTLLQKLLREQAMQQPALADQPVLAHSTQEELVASFSQEQIWVLDQLDPGSSAYNISFAALLEGELYPELLERSLQEIVCRHSILRTTFMEQNELLVPVIVPVLRLTVPVITYATHLVRQEQEQEMKRQLQLEIRKPFDLKNGPLVRVVLVRLSQQEHVFLLVMHHIISDGKSIDVFMYELTQLYNTFLLDRPSPLSPLPIQYTDFALWQRKQLQDVLDAQLPYWSRQLDGLVPLQLSTDHPRRAIQTFNGSHQFFTLPRSLLDELRVLSQRSGVTLFMLLLTAFQTLLYRYTGQVDIAVGTPVANRSRSELEGLIGYFVNMLVMRTNLAGNPGFFVLLERVRKVVSDAFAHQDIPFTRLVAELHPERSLSHSPLFQVTFALQNASMVGMGLKLADLSLSILPIENGTARFDLALEIVETDQGLVSLLEYNTDLFASSTIERLLGHWQHLLQGIVATPQARLSDLPLLSATERGELLQQWNATQHPWPVQGSLQAQIWQQARRTPDAVALVSGQDSLSYDRMQRAAAGLARLLHLQGLLPQRPVALYGERTPLLAIGLLGILRAGGSLLPLEVGWPESRLQQVLVGSGTSLLLTSPAHREQARGLAARCGVSVLCLSQAWDQILQGEEEAVYEPGGRAQDLGYLLYTSGSSGEPKGVLVPQGALLNRLHWGIEASGLGAEDRVGQVASWGFDIALWELLGPWLVGGCSVLFARGQVQEHRELLKGMQQEAITVQHLVPSLLGVLLQEGGLSRCQSLRRVQTGGEAVPEDLVRRVQREVAVEVEQFYGPTEAAISVLGWEGERAGRWERLTLGRAISNVQVYVVDRWGEVVPVGVQGELFIGGEALSWGYQGGAQETAERYVPDGLSGKAGSRLYRTGDRGRRIETGEIVFEGRVDAQIKLRGHRIEPGEIEVVLQEHPAIKQAVVIVRENSLNEKWLLAYLVYQQNHLLIDASSSVKDTGSSSHLHRKAEIRQYLQSCLPEYMIPSVFVPLESLPLTLNGKIDRRALPDPDTLVSETLVVQPRTPVEALLGEIWCEVLKCQKIGIDDNFFELGGHSLLAARLIARVRQLCQIELSLRSLFETPTIAGLAQQIEGALGKPGESLVPLLRSQPRPEMIPLSFAQQRLWFLNELELESTAYLIPVVLRLNGLLQVRVLEESLRRLQERHESLRTRFLVCGGKPVQQIDASIELVLPIIDLQGIGAHRRVAEAQLLAAQEAMVPCDLVQGPLWRVRVVRVEEREHLLFLTMHHSISDGWSSDIVQRELGIYYRNLVRGEEVELPRLPVQYADYALWQREWLQGEIVEGHLAYWRTKLAGVSPLELPMDHLRPPVQSYRGGRQSRLLPASLHEELIALSRREGGTLFMVLLAAFNVLLARYSGQHDISIGTPVSNRMRSEVEGVIGFFVNTLVIRSDLSGNPSFLEVLRRVREGVLEDWVHQDIPFERLVEALHPQRDMSRSPLFQVMFDIQYVSEMKELLEDLVLEVVPSEQMATQFDLSLTIVDNTHTLDCVVEYSTDLFEDEAITRMLRNWQTLLEGIVVAAHVAVADLPLLSEAERQLSVISWNDTWTPFPTELCIYELIDEQMCSTPDAVAVVSGDQHLSYASLCERANQLAHYLRRLGIQPETRVGVCIERSPALLVAILGAVKASGAYVPLDPFSPSERLLFMLEDADVAFVLGNTRTIQNLPARDTMLVVALDKERYRIAQESREAPSRCVFAENLAYIIYTSGSTGVPKGVMVSHASLVNAYYAWNQAYALRSRYQTFLQMAHVAFDVFTGDIVRALCSGGRLVLCPQELLLDAPQLFALLRREHVDCAEFVPVVLRHLLRYLQESKQKLDMMQTVIVGSDVWYGQEHHELQSVCGPHTRLINSYGLTEATIDSAFFEGYVQTSEDKRAVALGHPLANMQLYVLDDRYTPVPVGCSGELYVGGAGLARGYRKRPELTAEKFIPHPWSNMPGARLYRTGDSARYQSDGTILYVGRRDYQVKIRGYRIELEEIEALLLRHPEVGECAVLVRGMEEQGETLVAYVVFRGGVIDSDALRHYLREYLPHYMIPDIFAVLNELPLTSNGKIDRRALPSFEESRDSIRGRDGVKPRTTIESLLVEIWCEVLRLREIGIDDNFFELGGHSLLAAQLISRVRQLYQVELSLRSLFETPTIAGLAQQIEAAFTRSEVVQIPPLIPQLRPAMIPLSFAQQRLWFLDQLEPGTTAYLIPMVLRFCGPLQVQAFEQSLRMLQKRHESLRTRFPLRGREPVQEIEVNGNLQLPIIDLQGIEMTSCELQVQRLMAQEAALPCDLVQGPLWRVGMIRVGEQEHIFLLTMHHSISDGWSDDVMQQELGVCYRSYVQAEEVHLPDLPVQYADYALWQRSWLQGEVMEAHLAYWRAKLEGASPLELPADRLRPPVQTSHGAFYAHWLPLSLREDLMVLSRREGVTLFMLLLAAFQVLLARYSGQWDICVGTPVANRTRREIEGVIGFFVNTLVIRGDLSGNPSFIEVLRQVREEVLGASVHQDVPFERLVEALQQQRDLSRSPLFQIMFGLQQGEDTVKAFEELTVSSIDGKHITAKFDLTLFVVNDASNFRCGAEYNTDLFEEETIRQMMHCWQTLLEGIVAAPQSRLAALPLLTKTQQHDLLRVCQTEPGTQTPKYFLQDLVECQRVRTPDAVALVFEETMLSYEGLLQRAHRVASQLREQGVGAEVRVGICLERTPVLLIGVLGVLLAGGAYVPLEPNGPLPRQRQVLEETGASLVLIQRGERERLQVLASRVLEIEALLMDDQAEREQEGHAPFSEVAGGAEQLAYVISTSGSTGRPKGVGITHRSATAFIGWALEVFGPQELSGVLASTALGFDLSIFELFVPLCAGGTVILVENALHLPELEAAGRVTLINTVPSVASELARVGGVPETVRVVNVAGEPLERRVVQQVYRTGQVERVVNLYGPTEDTTYSTWGVVADEEGGRVSIGRPVAGGQVYVLDEEGNLVPPGVSGELYLGGVGLARGYEGRPDLTAERFVPDAFDQRGGGRVYRTGDRGRYRWDGQLEYQGRRDRQVKVRGFRIELGEIESVLREAEGVAAAVVEVREGQAGGKHLVGYVVPQTGRTLSGEEVRGVQQRLPAYMVPTTFHFLEALPLTAHGKIDRRALPVLAPVVTREHEIVLPRTEVEQQLAAIWGQVLYSEQVGIHDNFFALGGDSILTIQIVARAREVGIMLTTRHLFQHQTIAELAAVVPSLPLVPSIMEERGPASGIVPLTPIQHWFFEQALTAPQHWNQAVLLTLRPSVSPALLPQALEYLIGYHDSLRLRFLYSRAQGWQQHYGEEEIHISLPIISLEQLAASERVEVLEALSSEWQASLNLEVGPLLRVCLFDLGNQEPLRMLFVLHHLLVDGVSWRILIEDLQRICEQMCAGRTVQLPPRTSSYQSWAQRLSALAQRQDLREEESFWQEQGRRGTSSFPEDLPEGENTVASSRTVTWVLGRAETKALLTQVQSAYHTGIDKILLTALVHTICAWTGEDVLWLDLEYHGRELLFEDIDLSRSVGWFTCLYPIRLDLKKSADGDAGPEYQIKAIKEQLSALPRHGLSYGMLRYLCKDRAIAGRMRSLPEAQIVFNYLGQFDQVFEPEGFFTLARESSGWSEDPTDRRTHLLEVSGSIIDGQLQISWNYSQNIHHERTIATLSQRYGRALRDIIAHSSALEAGGYTPADFPLAELNQSQVDAFLTRWPKIEDIYPPSPLQDGLLFHTLYRPDTGVYVIQVAWLLQGRLHLQAFERAWQRVLHLHASLRTAFCWDGERRFLQVVPCTVQMPLHVLDMRGLAMMEQQRQREIIQQVDRTLGFALDLPPLLRVTLLYEGEERFFVLWSYHHIVLDGWSLPLLLHDLWWAYQQECSGGTHAPGRVHSGSYRNYIAWLQQQDLAQAQQFWRSYLENIDHSTPLLLDRAVPATDTQVAEVGIALSPQLTDRLQAEARRQRVTINTLIQGTWALLLSRYSGEEIVIFGAIDAGRSMALPGIESMVGLFINALPIRAKIEAEALLWEWLRQLQEQQIEARQYNYTPLVQIQEWSSLLPGQQLFESLLVFENYPVGDAVGERLQDLEIVEMQMREQTHYALTILVTLREEVLSFQILYDPARFAMETVQRLLESWQTLLESVIAQPEQRLDALPLLSQARQQVVREAYNRRQQALPGGGVLALVEAQVTRTPDRVALSWQEQSLSYGQMWVLVQRVARCLRVHGCQVETPVAVLMDRSPLLAVVMLACWQAGGVYLPLDPLQPAARLRAIVRGSRPPLLLVSRPLQPLLEQVLWLEEEVEALGGQMLWLEEEVGRWQEEPEAENEGARARWPQPRQLAYVLFTSGSTGAPKGVMVEQEGMLNHILAKIADVELGGQDVLAHSSPQGFDISVWQAIAALIVGGRGEVLSDEQAFFPGQLMQGVRERGITVLQLVPALLRGVLSEEEEQRARGRVPGVGALRWMIPTGEALPTDLCRRWWRYSPQIPLLNTYGSTECSDDQCHYVLRDLSERDARLPIVAIGYPIVNMQRYVLDERGELVGPGMVGELYLGGVGVGRGYQGDAERTAHVFVPDAYGQERGGRLYKTNDQVRLLGDGNVEFVGRKDQVIKVHGHRIEPGEIEAHLREHGRVREAVVVSRKRAGEGEEQLVGYVECRQQEGEMGKVDWRGYLQERVPGYMIPAVVVEMEEWPVNANGKLDRGKLPEPGWEAEGRSEQGTERRSVWEELVGGVWEEVIGTAGLGREENFFERGGHSLLAVRVIARMRQALGVEMGVRSLFEAPTLKGWSKRVEEAVRGGGERKPKVERREREGDLPLSFGQQRLWFLDQLDPGSPAYNIPGGIHLRGVVKVDLLEKSLRMIVQRHESLRTTFQNHNGIAVQIITPGAHFSLQKVCLSGLPYDQQEREVWRLANQDALKPFSLAEGPLLRGLLLRQSREEHILLLTMHHIISDAWSMEVLMRELAFFYRAFAEGHLVSLPELPIQYADYAFWQRQVLQGEVLDEYVDYWVRQLGGAVPLDMTLVEGSRKQQGPVAASSRGATHTFILSPQLSKALQVLCRQEDVTLFMALFGAFQVLLYRTTGQQDLVVGTDVANRTHVETEQIIGFFVNVLALRTRINPHDTFREFLKSIRQTVLGAYVHQDLPFEKLVDALQLERAGYQIPLTNVLFVLQNTAPPALELSGLDVRPFDIEIKTAKFDLAVFMIEDEQGLSGFVNYRADLFPPESISTLFTHFIVLLEHIVSFPEVPVETLEIYTEQERERQQQTELSHQEGKRRKLKAIKRREVVLPEQDIS